MRVYPYYVVYGTIMDANLANHGSARISRVDSLLIVNVISFAFLAD